MVGTPLALPADGLLTLTGSPLYFEAKDKPAAEKLAGALETARIEQITTRFCWDGERNQLRFALHNESSQELSARIALDAPAGWVPLVSSQNCVLKPDSQNAFSFAFENIQFDPDNDRLIVSVITTNDTITAKWNPFPCLYAAKAPALDGDFAEWRQGIPVKLGAGRRRGVADSRWGGDSDLSATVYAQWDKECLYLGVEVNDDIYAAPHTGNMIWANDAVQVAFDPLNDAMENEKYNVDDCEYTVCLTASGQVEVECNRKAANGVRAAVKRAPGKIFYELAFPWSSLAPMDPKTRRDMGFNLTVMDNDGDEKRFPQYRGWHQYLQITDGIVGTKSPAAFKDLLLLEKKP